jgi:ribose transport system substrate-binding protein
MKVRSIVVLASVLAIVVAGCGSVHESGGGSGGGTTQKKSGSLRLAVVPKAVGFDFWNQVKTGV